ncbi:MAG: hypothetical protein Q9168_000467 [Polycauliona sp. 1 TL-2023]
MANVYLNQPLHPSAGPTAGGGFKHHPLSLPMKSESMIRNPPKPNPDAPIIIYLPSGLRTDEHDRTVHNPLHTLALSAHATVVEIGYRLSPKIPYPKPIHDVVAGYDWIRKHLCPSPSRTYSNSSYAPPQPQPKKRIGVCGELAGGSLAAMLAITECNPNSITAAALGNPIVDWSSPLQPPASNESNSLGRNIKNLHTNSFAKPEHRYDPFASPLLFFRTPAYELPTPSLYGNSFPPSASPNAASTSSSELVTRRRSHRKHPPQGSGLVFPATRIDIGSDFMMRDQAIEFAELMQRSVKLYEREVRTTARDDRVEIVEREHEGLWEEKDVMDIGRWMGEMLRRE